MFGTLVNNRHLLHLRERGAIKITPFNEKYLKTAHYPLRPEAVFRREVDGSLKRAHSFSENKNPYQMNEGEYVVVQIRELIVLEPGILGEFIPSSNLIEQGLGITAGRLEHPFGQKNEVVRFGLKNFLEAPNEIRADQYLAYIQFFDLRGLSTKSYELTKRDLELFAKRVVQGYKARAKDGGVFYPPEGEEFEVDED